jgi:hypothetical protein
VQFQSPPEDTPQVVPGTWTLVQTMEVETDIAINAMLIRTMVPDNVYLPRNEIYSYLRKTDERYEIRQTNDN